jgi:glycosyltransferase involved in cell wall biosynthesis
LRVIHYYRDATRPSGVTTAILGWQRAAHRVAIESEVHHAPTGGEWPDAAKSIPHFGKGRQAQVPHQVDWRRSDVVVLHEGWVSSNYVAAITCRLRGVPYIVMPHGVYEPGVMKDLRFAKIRRWIERLYLKNAAAVHTFFIGEAQLVRALSPSANPVVIPMGYQPSPFHSPARTSEREYLAWFGRYDPSHKGLDRMLYAYALIPPSKRLPLLLRGVDYRGGKRKVALLVEQLGLEHEVQVGPWISEDEKHEFLSGAAGFIFPSRWEGYGIALIEALDAALPVLVADSIQFANQLKAHEAAVVADFRDLSRTAQEMADLPNQTSVGERGRVFVRDQLNWEVIAIEYGKFLRELAVPRRQRAYFGGAVSHG